MVIVDYHTTSGLWQVQYNNRNQAKTKIKQVLKRGYLEIDGPNTYTFIPVPQITEIHIPN